MFTKQFFMASRQRLTQALPDSLVVISAHALLQQSADLQYPFRQDSNFWYLTGISEPDLVLVIDTKKGVSTLLLPTLNDYQKEWDGGLDTKKLEQISGITKFADRSSLASMVRNAKKRQLQICSFTPSDERLEPYGFYTNPARRLLAAELAATGATFQDIRLSVARLRQQKQPEEIAAIQQAIDITATTLQSVKESLSTYNSEAEIERAITVGFYQHGANGHAYEPIVAGGSNAAVIHYNKNSDSLTANSLLLLDVGAQYGGYAADISRTWSLDKPTDRQKALHAAMLELQQAAYKLLGPGVLLRSYQKEMEQQAKKILTKLNCSTAHLPYPHGFSHFLGLDVHDAGDYEAPIIVGSVLTVEPGVYLQDEGIGIRIEDDILITESGLEILSSQISSDL